VSNAQRYRGLIFAAVEQVASGENFWRHCNVTAYYAVGWDVQSVVQMVAESFELPALPRFSVDSIPDRDWVKKVQEGWPPLMVGDLLLRFPWHSSEDIARVLPSGRSERSVSLLCWLM
jgi:ribosomal protein L11 methylase PrmA